MTGGAFVEVCSLANTGGGGGRVTALLTLRSSTQTRELFGSGTMPTRDLDWKKVLRGGLLDGAGI